MGDIVFTGIEQAPKCIYVIDRFNGTRKDSRLFKVETKKISSFTTVEK